MTAVVRRTGVDICIGGVTVRVRSSGKAFLRMLDERYAGFMVHGGVPDYEFDVELTPPRDGSPDDDVRVWRSDGLWHLQRGDFRAEWDPVARQGRIRHDGKIINVPNVWRTKHVDFGRGPKPLVSVGWGDVSHLQPLQPG